MVRGKGETGSTNISFDAETCARGQRGKRENWRSSERRSARFQAYSRVCCSASASSASRFTILPVPLSLPSSISFFSTLPMLPLNLYERGSLLILAQLLVTNLIHFVERKQRTVNGLQIRECHVFMYPLHHDLSMGSSLLEDCIFLPSPSIAPLRVVSTHAG